jgi:hypothetical protein
MQLAENRRGLRRSQPLLMSCIHASDRRRDAPVSEQLHGTAATVARDQPKIAETASDNHRPRRCGRVLRAFKGGLKGDRVRARLPGGRRVERRLAGTSLHPSTLMAFEAAYTSTSTGDSCMTPSAGKPRAVEAFLLRWIAPYQGTAAQLLGDTTMLPPTRLERNQ